MPKFNTISEAQRCDNIWEIDLDYAMFTPEGKFHTYPAKAVPEVARELLYRLKKYYGVKTVLDPFVGSGTVALESKMLNLDFYGSDLNPLAILLSRTKSLTIKNTSYVKKQLVNFIEDLSTSTVGDFPFRIETFKNIEYWFKKENIQQLSYLKSRIYFFLKSRKGAQKETFALILLTAFSSTIRASSLTRNGEFKLYRIEQNDIPTFEVNSINIFIKKVKDLLSMIEKTNVKFNGEVKNEIHLENAKKLTYLNGARIDLVLTSPPYGDSKSTVSYGQFSRLSLQWMSEMLKKFLSIKVVSEDCDEYLLGGKHSLDADNDRVTISEITKYSSTLEKLIADIETLIENELEIHKNKKEILLSLEKKLKDEMVFDLELFYKNDQLSKIIIERIRLNILRRVREQNPGINRKDISSIVSKELQVFIKDLANNNENDINFLLTIIPNIRQSINAKIRSLPKRSQEITEFFLDLYQVVKKTDSVLANQGIQAWLVGHRTIFGKLHVKLADILVEWFSNLNYNEITSLKRHCSFKRMPHHINSTATRNEEIKTMMEEYIIVVQKQRI